MCRQGRKRRVAGYLLVVLMGLALVGCTPKTEVAKVTSSGYEVKRDLTKAWATTTDVTHLDELTDGSWHALLLNGLVTTDKNGQAQLCPGASISAATQICSDVACHIYLYQKGQLVMRACSKASLGDADACSGEGVAVFDGCPVTVQTMSANVTGLGTWFAVTYLADLQLTLVIVGEGQVRVAPVTALEFDRQDPADYTFGRRELGEAVTTAKSEEPQFLYTAPDESLKKLPETFTRALPPRTSLSIVDLPPLVDGLQPFAPDIVPWVDRVVERADLDGFRFSDIMAAMRQELFVRGEGELTTDRRVQDAILMGVSWQALGEEVFAGQDVTFVVQMPERELGDAREVGHDPDKARTLLEESGADPLVTVLFYPEADQQLAVLARSMAGELGRIGMKVQMSGVPADEMAQMVKTAVAGGKSVLWLGRE